MSVLTDINSEIEICQNCELAKRRTRAVPGEGPENAKIMFIGEAPGWHEDQQGRPFVGPAGQFLEQLLASIGLKRQDVYIANVVKCRPTVNQEGTRDRPPEKDEVAACGWMLHRQIEIISPKVIITLGNPSTKYILNTELGITKIRGNFSEYKGIKVMPTYHPSYILRNGGDSSPLKRDVWSDIKKVLKYLDMPFPGRMR